MKISARNILRGTIKEITEGAVNVEVAIGLPDGQKITSVITKESAKSLGLKCGQKAYAVIKASSVMIGVD